MKEEVFYKHVRETTFTKDYTVCGKVVKIDTPFPPSSDVGHYHYELHIGVYVFPVNDLFIKKVGCTNSLLEANSDPLVKIKLADVYSLHTFLDFYKTLVPAKAIKRKIYLDQVIS